MRRYWFVRYIQYVLVKLRQKLYKKIFGSKVFFRENGFNQKEKLPEISIEENKLSNQMKTPGI